MRFCISHNYLNFFNLKIVYDKSSSKQFITFETRSLIQPSGVLKIVRISIVSIRTELNMLYTNIDVICIRHLISFSVKYSLERLCFFRTKN